MKNILTIIFSLFLMLNQALANVSEGEKLPTFNLQTLKGGGSFSSSSLHGKVALIDFWASWCIPCRSALPAYQNIYHKFSGKGFKIVAIGEDKDAQTAQNFLSKFNLSYTILHDPDGQVAATFDLPTMPTSYLVGKNGVVIKVYAGFHNGNVTQIENDIQQALGS